MTKEKKILLNYLLKQYKQSLHESNNSALQLLNYQLGNNLFKFVQPYGSLWKSKNNVIFIEPIRRNSGFGDYLEKLNFIDKVEEAGNNIYKVVINNQVLADFMNKKK